MQTVSSVQFTCSVLPDSATPWITACQASPSITNSQSSSNSCPSSRWCHPAISSSVAPFSSCLQSLPASVFSKESTLRMKKYWSFSFSIIPSKEHPGLTSFKMDWLNLLAVQGTTHNIYVSVSSVAQSCLTLCDPVNQSTPGLPVQRQLPEFTQAHVHRGSDAI